MKHLLLIAAMLLPMVGCTDAEMASFKAYGDEHHIELWSGGSKVREWTSTGKVHSEQSSDGYYFQDKETGKVVRVTGDLVVTPVEASE